MSKSNFTHGLQLRDKAASRRPGHLRKVSIRHSSLADRLELLESRSMLAADVLDVGTVVWNGALIEAVKDEYVFRMPQLNAATAKSPVDYQCTTPVVRPTWTLQNLGSGFFKLTAPGASQTAVSAWASSKGAQAITVNAVRSLAKAPNDPLYSSAENWAFPKISADKAWDIGTGTASSIVAVMDSGVDYTHADVAANMWKNPNEIAGDGVDNDKNGWVDDVFGVNTIGGTADPMDDSGHGTVCAGLIGAVGDNSVGIAGVNWTTKIMAIKIFDAAGNTSIAAEVQGIQYIINQKIAGQNVAATNCSFGGYSFVQQEFDALNQLSQAGVLVVAAAGNEANNNDVTPVYPASYSIPGVLSVAASTSGDALANFSNYGVTSVDVAAPGVQVLSTRASLASPSEYPPLNGDLRYTVESGTSFAAPLVAGTAGLLKSLKSAASGQQIKNAILNGADRVSGLNGKILTAARLNVSNAVTLLNASAGPTPVASFKADQSLRFLEGNAGYAFADIKVVLDRPCDPGKSVSVWFDTLAGGSAFIGTDFIAQSGAVTFSGKETEKLIRVKLVGERIPEADEQFVIRLDPTKSQGVAVGDGLATITILDDDNTVNPGQPGGTDPLLPLVSLAAKTQSDPTTPGGTVPVAIREGSPATFVVSLDRTSNKTISVKYRTMQPVVVPAGVASEGLDYLAAAGTVTFRPGERMKEFTVNVLADKLAEGAETFRVALSAPVNAQLAGENSDAASAVTATIENVPYIPPQAPGFQITLNYLGSVPTAIRNAAIWAASRWSQVITGDVADVIDPQSGAVVDDIVIDVQVGLLGGQATDGMGGILANAGATEFRSTGTMLPWKASAGIDAADVSNPLLQQIVLHEFGHALGFGGNVFAQKNLVSVDGRGFVGANAVREYRSIFQQAAAVSVPLDTTGGNGTAGSHWDETVFQTELMSGYVANATSMPLSRVTVGAMADIGYQVNYGKADTFAKPALKVSAVTPGMTVGGIRLRSAALMTDFGTAELGGQSATSRPTMATMERISARFFVSAGLQATGSGSSSRSRVHAARG